MIKAEEEKAQAAESLKKSVISKPGVITTKLLGTPSKLPVDWSLEDEKLYAYGGDY